MRTLALAVLLATSALAAKPVVSSVRLYVIDCGRLKVEDPSRFDFRKEQLKELDFSVGCYLIAHPKGVLLWDAGVVPDSMFKNGQGTKFYGSATKTLTSQMAASGYTPADVNYFVLSHYHWDHIGNAALFAKSTWLVERIEHDTLFGPTPPERVTPDQYQPLAKSKTVYLPESRLRCFRRRNSGDQARLRSHARTQCVVREAGQDGSGGVVRRSAITIPKK